MNGRGYEDIMRKNIHEMANDGYIMCNNQVAKDVKIGTLEVKLDATLEHVNFP